MVEQRTQESQSDFFFFSNYIGRYGRVQGEARPHIMVGSDRTAWAVLDHIKRTQVVGLVHHEKEFRHLEAGGALDDRNLEKALKVDASLTTRTEVGARGDRLDMFHVHARATGRKALLIHLHGVWVLGHFAQAQVLGLLRLDGYCVNCDIDPCDG